MKKLSRRMLSLIIVALCFFMFTECSNNGVTFDQKGWSLLFNPQNETFTIAYKELGVILGDVKLNIDKDGELLTLSGWTLEKKDNELVTITTSQPEKTSWSFVITDEGLDINSSTDDAVITGKANADGSRIPARVGSQDNGIIFTSLGYVSAKNIYCIFDRATDMLIQFPQKTDLTRNVKDNKIMDVTFPLLPNWGRREGRGTRTRRGDKIMPTIEMMVVPNYYTETLDLKVYNPYWPQYPDKRPFQKAPTGWLSWYCYYMPANEEDMVVETDALSQDLKQYGLDYVQLDATFTGGVDANWLEWDKEKFPKGGKWIMQYIKSKGLKPGLWVNIYGANHDKPAFGSQFPDGKYPENYYLHSKTGQLLRACCTADSTVVRLDFSNPAVIEKHLRPLFETLVNDWGIEYLKDAGHARWQWSYEENRERVYNPSLEGRALYWKAQDVVREVMGPKNFLMGCDAEGGSDYYSLGFGVFDSAFDILSDVYNVWERQSRFGGNSTGTVMHLATMFSANYLNDIVLYNDPDATMARLPLTMDEAITNITSISLTGQSYMISDFMAQPSEERANVLKTRTRLGRDYPQLIKKLPEDRLDLYRRTMPAMDITPIDLFPFRSKAEYAPLPDGYPAKDSFPKALDLKVKSQIGVYDVLSIYNWEDAITDKEVTFADLGLDISKTYLAFDFWNQKLLGTFENSIQCTVPTHGSRVLVIKPISDEPQVMATSRHITGAYSIKSLNWDKDNLTLTGSSETVAGSPYTLFVHVPQGMTVSKVNANASDVSQTIDSDGVLLFGMQGQQEPINWTITFKKGI
ncbi:hypothetical protein JXQ31_19935 [candidate division KSB1 bacterium]|nr:hypothetical protein [candidate division KSB1 bacterium]